LAVVLRRESSFKEGRQADERRRLRRRNCQKGKRRGKPKFIYA
jgi:hypothetical protein